MLTATVEQNGKVWKERLFVIDSHSHLGQDIDGAANMNPLAPGGTFDFWGNVQGKIKADWEKKGEQSFSTVIDGKQTKISWEFTPYPFTDKLYAALEKIGQKHSDLKDKAKFYSFIDQGVVFPFQDTFRDKEPTLYKSSNSNIARFTTRFPFSMKLIGYCRVDPMQGEPAVKEVTRARVELGVRGLKLHPRSEGWVDHVTSDKPIPVMIEAARHSMPIIFDTRGKVTIMDIGKLVTQTRNAIKAKHPELLPHFKVIIAHFAQGNIGDHDVYNTIVQPNVYGDLSMLHGEGASNFFQDFRQWFKSHNKINVDGRDWSEYLLFASDFPYFGDVHAEKLMIHIINKGFFDSGGTLKDTRNILGLNQLKLLPEYNVSQARRDVQIKPTTMISNPNYSQNQLSSYDIGITALAKLLVENKIDIKKFCIQFDESWDKFTENLFLTITSNISKKELNVLFMNIIKDQASLIAPLQPDQEWKKFGYKYFDPMDREFFAAFFKTNYLATDEVKASELLANIFS